MRKKILVVDDDADLAELLGFYLTQAGYLVVSAANGAEALKKIRTFEPALIILDVMMPELDGLAVCEILRRDPATAQLPVLMLTALSSELGRIAGLDSGASDFMSKPFSPRAIVARVEELLKKSEELFHTAAPH